MKIPEDLQFLTRSDQPVWHKQPVQSHLYHLSAPFRMLSLNFSRSSWSCLHA